jgi:hypothetical protein
MICYLLGTLLTLGGAGWTAMKIFSFLEIGLVLDGSMILPLWPGLCAIVVGLAAVALGWILQRRDRIKTD